mgnify:CR=1 FL=1
MVKAPSQASVKSVAVGPHKGFIVTKPKVKRARPSSRKGKGSKRTHEIQKLVSSMVGMTPFQKKFYEMIKSDVEKVTVRAIRLAKRRYGSRKRALTLRKNMENLIKNAHKD